MQKKREILTLGSFGRGDELFKHKDSQISGEPIGRNA